MKLRLYRHQLDLDHYRFARQAGCIHLVDYFKSSRSNKPGERLSSTKATLMGSGCCGV